MANNNLQNTPPASKHAKRQYVILILIVFIILSALLLFFLEQTIGLERILSPSVNVEDSLKLRKESVNRVIKTRRYMDIPEAIQATLYDEQQRPVFLSIRVSFELQLDNDRDEIAKVIPIILDSTQSYLRSIRPSELNGTQGIYRVREEMIFRINRIIAPVVINDVLFKEFSLQ